MLVEKKITNNFFFVNPKKFNLYSNLINLLNAIDALFMMKKTIFFSVWKELFLNRKEIFYYLAKYD